MKKAGILTIVFYWQVSKVGVSQIQPPWDSHTGVVHGKDWNRKLNSKIGLADFGKNEPKASSSCLRQIL